MGKKQSKIQESYNPNLSAWELLSSIDDNKVWRNAITKEEIREYGFIVNESKEFDKFKLAHQLRYENKTLVSSRFFSQDSNTQMCSTFYKGKIYLERIPFTIQNLIDIPFPQVLHIYKQAFIGFGELYQHRGYFYIDPGMIGFNNKFQAKVWLNSEFEKIDINSYIQQQKGNSRKENQLQMIYRILQIVDERTNQASCPQNFSKFIIQSFQTSPNLPQTLRSAENLLNSYAQMHHFNIPEQLDSLASVDLNRIKTNNVRLSELVTSTRKLENNSSLISKVVTYNNQTNPIQIVNPSPIFPIQNQNSAIISNRIQTPQPYIYTPQTNQNNLIKFTNSSNNRNTLIDSKPIEVIRNPAVNKSIKIQSNIPVTNSFIQKNSLSQQQLIQRAPINTQFINTGKSEIKIAFGNQPAKILTTVNNIQNKNIPATQINFQNNPGIVAGVQSPTGFQNNILAQNNPNLKNYIVTQNTGLNLNNTATQNNINFQNNNKIVQNNAGFQNNAVIRNSANISNTSNSNNIIRNQFNQRPQSITSYINISNRAPQKNENEFVSNIPTATYNTEIFSRQQPKSSQTQSIETKSYSYTYDYLNSNNNMNSDKINSYSNNQNLDTAGEFKYQYTSPEIQALLSKNFNFSSTLPSTEYTTTQKLPQKIIKLDGINEMKYSIYEDTSNKYISEPLKYQGITNVESSTQLADTEGKSNTVSYSGQNGYSIAFDPTLAKDLELFKQGNQRN